MESSRKTHGKFKENLKKLSSKIHRKRKFERKKKFFAPQNHRQHCQGSTVNDAHNKFS